MDQERQANGGIGSLLTAFRLEKGFTKQSLADASGVSATYVSMIEGGIDSRSGKEIRPSPDTLKLLAEALGRGSPEEADRLYTRMMAVLDYLPRSYVSDEQRSGVQVVLRDPELHEHLRPVLERWDLLTEDERISILTLSKLLDRELRRR